MVKYKFSDDGTVLTIFDSYAIPKSKFQRNLNCIKSIHGDKPIFTRTDTSLKKEWAVHNALYAIGLLRSHTKDVDFNIPQSALIRFAYCFCGTIVWPFIK